MHQKIKIFKLNFSCKILEANDFNAAYSNSVYPRFKEPTLIKKRLCYKFITIFFLAGYKNNFLFYYLPAVKELTKSMLIPIIKSAWRSLPKRVSWKNLICMNRRSARVWIGLDYSYDSFYVSDKCAESCIPGIVSILWLKFRDKKMHFSDLSSPKQIGYQYPCVLPCFALFFSQFVALA